MTKRSGVRRIVIGAAIVVVGGIGWYLFRPELLFVNKIVNEALPSTAETKPPSIRASESRTLAMGMFHGGAHETKGTAAIPLAGQLIYAVGEPEGYQVSLGIAFAIGLIAVYYYAQIPEHSGTFRRVRVSMRRIVTDAAPEAGKRGSASS